MDIKFQSAAVKHERNVLREGSEYQNGRLAAKWGMVNGYRDSQKPWDCQKKPMVKKGGA